MIDIAEVREAIAAANIEGSLIVYNGDGTVSGIRAFGGGDAEDADACANAAALLIASAPVWLTELCDHVEELEREAAALQAERDLLREEVRDFKCAIDDVAAQLHAVSHVKPPVGSS